MVNSHFSYIFTIISTQISQKEIEIPSPPPYNIFYKTHIWGDFYDDQYSSCAADRAAFSYDFYGLFNRKAGLLKDEDSKVLSKIVLYLIIPCVILNAFQVDYTPETVRGLLVAFAASLLMQVVLLFAVSALGRVFHLDAVEITSVYYSNSGNLIVPLVTAVLGAEWVLYNGACSSENQPSCRSFCRRTDADSDCFSRRHHAICLYSYTDVSGIRKRFTLCQCHQCCYHAGFYCDDAAFGDAASNGTLITINRKTLSRFPF